VTTLAHIPIEEYLRTIYEPDEDYVDGTVEERNLGEYDHNAAQKVLLFWFARHEKQWGIRVIQEQRIRLSSTRVRIPDVSIFPREFLIEQVFTRPPLIAIEVLSPEDRHSQMQEKINDYRSFGVSKVWIFDPKQRTGWDASDGNWIRHQRFTMPGSQFISLSKRSSLNSI
jgi:Uma2 family endonuclease